MIDLTPIDVENLEEFSCLYNLRKDLHVFADYVSWHSVKRTTRGNHLPKADARRLAKLMSDPDALEYIDAEAWEMTWLKFIDKLALTLGFVNYSTEGQYRGYSSVELSYTDNYIEFKEKQYNRFLSMSLLKQERRLVEALVGDYSYGKNEFYVTGVMGCLDTFDGRGCAMGVMPYLNFERARIFLFDLLKSCECDVWYSTASLVAYLKNKHPYFLIPKKPKYKNNYGKKDGRYGNFKERYEDSDGWERERVHISEASRDAFERVEGRYIERFLENIPLILGYVSVAYDAAPASSDRKPSLNRLKAFKLNESFFKYMQGNIPEPKVVVQPNFELYIESEVYPAKTLDTLLPMTDLISEDTITILKLNKKKVAACLANDSALDIVTLLKRFSGRELPENVEIELKHWSDHSEMFVLYDGFSLLESDKTPSCVTSYSVERITPSLNIVRSPDELYSDIEKEEFVPIMIDHPRNAFNSGPENIKTVFKKPLAKKRAKKKQAYTLKRKTSITLYFPTQSLMERCRGILIKRMCPIEVDFNENTILYQEKDTAVVTAVIKELRKEYRITIDNIDA